MNHWIEVQVPYQVFRYEITEDQYNELCEMEEPKYSQATGFYITHALENVDTEWETPTLETGDINDRKFGGTQVYPRTNQ